MMKPIEVIDVTINIILWPFYAVGLVVALPCSRFGGLEYIQGGPGYSKGKHVIVCNNGMTIRFLRCDLGPDHCVLDKIQAERAK